MASYEYWRLEKKSSCFRFEERIHIKLHQSAVGMLVALCKYCRHLPPKVVHLHLWVRFSCQHMSCFQSLLHFLPFCQVPSWDCQHYYNLWCCTAISLKQFPCTFIQTETQAGGPKVAGSCITLIQLPLS